MINVRQNKSFALVFSLIFLFLIISFIIVFMLTIANGLVIAHRTAKEIKAYYIAEAGLADAFERILKLPPGPSNTYIPSPNTDNGVYTMGDGSHGNYTVALAATFSPISYTITSTGTYDGVQKTLQLQIVGSAITKYSYWAQVEGNASWWITGQTVTGPVHSNGSLEIWGNPFFNGPVEQVGTSINAWGGSGYDQDTTFTGGLSLGVPAIPLPPVQTLTAIKAAASASGLVLTGPHIIQFNPNSTITYYQESVVNGPPTDSGTTIQAPTNPANCPYPNTPCSIIYVQSNTVNGTSQNDGTPTVYGTVSGQVTVAADQSIYISNNVAYNDPPVRPNIPGGNPNSTDLLGLVANNNIIINSSAPASLEIDGALVAIQGSVESDNGWVQGKGNMDEFGSLINYDLGVIGYFDPSNGNVVGGWNQLQFYDTRLLTVAPPGFPSAYNSLGQQIYTKVTFKEL